MNIEFDAPTGIVKGKLISFTPTNKSCGYELIFYNFESKQIENCGVDRVDDVRVIEN